MNHRNDVMQRRSGLSPERLSLLQRQLRRGRASDECHGIARRSDGTAPAPLSYAQQRMWFDHQWDPLAANHNRPTTLRLRGQLHVPDFERSLREIVRRHEILRTVFPAFDGEPVQRVLQTQDVWLPLEDLTRLPQEQRLVEAQQRLDAMLGEPFALESAPLFRMRLFRLDAHDHLFSFVAHHILLDAWSEVLFINELCTLYDSFSNGEAKPLPDLPVQYADFASWQRERVRDESSNEHTANWLEKLAGVLPILDLCADHPRTSIRSRRSATQSLMLPRPLVDRLEDLSRREDVTLFMTLLAAFNVLLCRYTGQTDIIVGTPVAARTRQETKALIGPFANMTALRTDLTGDPTFLELLQGVRQTCLEAYAHQDAPFDRLVTALNPQRASTHTPIFQVVFNLENLPEVPTTAGSLEVSVLDLGRRTTEHDLLVELTERDGEICCQFVHDADLFDAGTIRRLTEHYRTLLEGIVADPPQRLSDLPLLTEIERHQVIDSWNETQAEYPLGRAVHQLFEAQVRRTPDAIAVVFDSEVMTYRELNDKANQLARYLRTLGVGPDVTVGLCVDRSTTMLVGLLGILKAGGAYVPLDPAYPKERLAFMIADARAPILLTQASLLRYRLQQDARSAQPPLTVCLDTAWAAIDRQSRDDLVCQTSGDNLAYVIYTSGSTGRPKGVSIPHAALTNLLAAMSERPGLGPNDVLAALTSTSFDIAALELFLPLMAGARLLIASRDIAIDGVQLRAALEQWRPTIIQATPSTWHTLVQAGWLGGAEIKALCGGERLTRELAGELLARTGELWNLYGPTETTIWSVTGRVLAAVEPISIGRPIANTQVYVLDAGLQPAPIGVPGELYIGGDGLARGYLRRPDLTAERFVPNPFGGKPGARIYKTGDRARYLPDGSIEFLGRRDHQIKLRGFRIELGEIEAALGEHPAVHRCVVLAREASPASDSVGAGEDIRLVAYVTPERGATPHSERAARIPEGEAAGVHAARVLRVPGCVAPDARREDRPGRAACP